MYQNFYICFCDHAWSQEGGFNAVSACPECGAKEEPYISRDKAHFDASCGTYRPGDILNAHVIADMINGIPVCIVDRYSNDEEDRVDKCLYAYLLGCWQFIASPWREAKPDLSHIHHLIHSTAARYQGPELRSSHA